MKNMRRLLRLLGEAGLVACVIGASPHPSRAEVHQVNACGCYQNSAGSCFCGKGSKCGCPGECEPKGCEEKRQKEIEKEIKAETKKVEDADRMRREAAAEKQRKADEQTAALRRAEEEAAAVAAAESEKEAAALAAADREKEAALHAPDGGAVEEHAPAKSKKGKKSEKP